VSEPESFENVIQWYEEAKRYAPDELTLYLVGNKIDKAQHLVSSKKAREFAEQYGMHFAESSAKTGQGIDQIFQNIAADLYKKTMAKQREEEEDDAGPPMKSKSFRATSAPMKNKKKKRGCCDK